MSDQPPTPSPQDADAPEMSGRLLARLFAVPLLIVIMIVGSSVVVVLLFGWISTSQQLPITRLVEQIEAGAGDKVFSVALLPRDKEVWQAAMELANRLRSDGAEVIPPEQRADIARRLGAILDRHRGVEQTEMGQEMQQFMLTALGQIGEPASAPIIAAYATDERQPGRVRQHAVGALVLMRDTPAARELYPQLAALLESSDTALRISGTVAIGALAERGDPEAIAILARAYRSGDREVVWNAALGLARLGTSIALPALQDMLTREYWESQRVDLPKRSPDQEAQRGLTPVQVDGYLMVAIDAARQLGDPALRPAVEHLAGDRSPQVSTHARTALLQWDAPTGTSPSGGAKRSIGGRLAWV